MLGTLLAGIAVGIVFVFSALLNLYLKAQNLTLKGQIKVLAHEQVETDKNLQKLAADVQKSASVPYVINLSEQVVNQLADRVCARVQTVLISQNEAALQKLN